MLVVLCATLTHCIHRDDVTLLQVRGLTSLQGDYTLDDLFDDIQRMVELLAGLDTTRSIFGDIPLLAQLSEWVEGVAEFVEDLLSTGTVDDLSV